MNKQAFHDLLSKQVLVLDGAMGTMVQNLELPNSAYGGKEFGMLSDLLVFSRPDDVQNIHTEYYKAGSNAVETNTFGASPLRLQEFDFSRLDVSDFPAQKDGADLSSISLTDFCYRLNKQAAEIANQAKKEYQESAEYDGRPLFVFGSIGPSNWVLSSTNADLNRGTYEQIEENFYQQVLGLIDGGTDVLLFETQQDILETKVGVFGAQRAMKEKGVQLPVIAQVTVDQFMKMQIFNTDIHAALTTIQPIGIDVFGINCSIGPDLMVPTVRRLYEYSQLPISIVPNAGLPVSEAGRTVYKLQPNELAEHLKSFITEYGASIVGGCCGTNPQHIKAISSAVQGISPQPRKPDRKVYVSGPQTAVAMESDTALVRIGERLNVRGSKKVRLAVENEGKIDQHALEEVIVEQTRDLGLEIIDVCMDSNLVDTKSTLVEVIQSQTVDFQGAMCLDSFDVDALGEAVKVYPGRPMVNSISLEEYAPGVDKIDAVLEKTVHHAPLYICLTTGPSGPALTRDEKYDLAKQIIEKVTTKYPVKHEQLFIDINAFPIGAESVEGMNFALESIQAIPRIKAIHPDLRVTIGVGNLTNGLAGKPYMRKVLTSVFIHEARKNGLDAAIINPNHYVPVESLPPADYQLGLEVIQNRDMEAFEKLEEIAEAKKGNLVKKRSTYDDLEIIPAVCEKIKDGFKERKEGYFEFRGTRYEYRDKIVLQAKEIIKDMEPLVLINEHLMKAMQELGDGFAAGSVSLPHLLKSADVMKHVMGFLESYMKNKSGTGLEEGISYKGTVVLGTVYQDVHSIGKDLAKTLLENYGYRVIDLGVQVHLEDYLEAVKKYNAEVLGMSALLVQTSNHMITVAEMMKDQGLEHVDVLIGGAPVNSRHAAYVAMAGKEDTDNVRDNIFYCPSAMDGVNYLNALLDTNQREKVLQKNRLKLQDSYQRAVRKAAEERELFETLPRRKISFSQDHPVVKDFQVPVKYECSLTDFLPYINRKLLFPMNWKYGGKGTWEKKGITEEDLEQRLLELSQKIDANCWMRPQGVYALFPCKQVGMNEVAVYNPQDFQEEWGSFSFNDVIGAAKKDQFSVAQYFHPEKLDLIGIQVSSGGPDVDTIIQSMKNENQEEAHLLQGLSDRVAEDMADYIHERMVELVSFNGEAVSNRYSPGYPAMKSIQDNALIAKLLDAENYLGISLTEACEFYPTGTTGAVVCFHQEAGYR